MIKTTLKIDGMMCGMCEAHIKDTIRKAVPDADKVTADSGLTGEAGPKAGREPEAGGGLKVGRKPEADGGPAADGSSKADVKRT